MANMKIDETEFMELLAGNKRFLQSLDVKALRAEQRAARKTLLGQIEKQSAVRNIMYESKMYYNFYTKNKYGNPTEAAKAYHNYKQCSEALQAIKETQSLSGFLQALVKRDHAVYGSLQSATKESLQLLDHIVEDGAVKEVLPKEDMEIVLREIQKHGYTPTKALIDNFTELGKLIPGVGNRTVCTLSEIKALVACKMETMPESWKEPMNNIVKECQRQELARKAPAPIAPEPVM